jgi:hypothetical protein
MTGVSVCALCSELGKVCQCVPSVRVREGVSVCALCQS